MTELIVLAGIILSTSVDLHDVNFIIRQWVLSTMRMCVLA